jgi:hypothetical protein
MKRLASRSTWAHILPPQEPQCGQRRREEASHGPWRRPEGGQEAGGGDLHDLPADSLDLLDEDLHRSRGDAVEARLQERD